jgi:hypothetical protein
MFTVTITADTPMELRAKMRDLLGLDKEAGPEPSPAEQVAAAMEPPAKKPRKPRATGAARKSELQAQVAEKNNITLTTEPVAESAQIERSSVENAARAFAAKHGVAKAKELLKDFGASRVTEVPDERLNDLYDAIQAAS